MLYRSAFKIVILFLMIFILSSCGRMNKSSELPLENKVIPTSTSPTSNPTLDNSTEIKKSEHPTNSSTIENGSEIDPSTPSKVSPTNDANMDITEYSSEFNDIIKKYENPIEVKEYILKNISGLTNNEITELFGMLISYIERRADEYNTKINSEKYGALTDEYLNYIGDPDKFNEIKDNEYRQLIERIHMEGYYIPVYEFYFPVVEFNNYSLFNEFEQKLTDEYKTYYTLYYFDSNSVFGAEGILIASVDEFSDSLHQLDMFLTDFPDSKYKSDIEGIYNYYLCTYLLPLSEYGATGNNGVCTFGEQQIDNYKRVISEYAGSPFSRLIESYVEILKANNFYDGKNAEEFRSKFKG